LCLIQEGGADGEVYEIKGDELTIGRTAGDIRFPHDGYMSGRHARIIRRGDEFILQDDNSRNGTFKKIDGPVTLKSGDVLLIGKQLFRFEVLGS
jgi:pSer/pThr/pTyr-binding forkhead associated (FHA) protein